MAAASTLLSLAESYASSSSDSSSDDSEINNITENRKTNKRSNYSESNQSCNKRQKSENKCHNKTFQKAKPRECLPVPHDVLQMFNSSQQFDDYDNSTKHNGRIRSFPHERGNWATYVYLPCSPNPVLKNLITRLLNIANAELIFSPMEDFHMSLSRTIILRHHWIDLFVETLSEKIKESKRSRFVCWFENVELYTNEEKTRTFLGLKIGADLGCLQDLTLCVDNCLKEFKLKTFYNNPSFHMSIGWVVGDKMLQMDTLKLMQEQFLVAQEDQGDALLVEVAEIFCKIGNKVYNFSLEKH